MKSVISLHNSILWEMKILFRYNIHFMYRLLFGLRYDMKLCNKVYIYLNDVNAV